MNFSLGFCVNQGICLEWEINCVLHKRDPIGKSTTKSLTRECFREGDRNPLWKMWVPVRGWIEDCIAVRQNHSSNFIYAMIKYSKIILQIYVRGWIGIKSSQTHGDSDITKLMEYSLALPLWRVDLWRLKVERGRKSNWSWKKITFSSLFLVDSCLSPLFLCIRDVRLVWLLQTERHIAIEGMVYWWGGWKGKFSYRISQSTQFFTYEEILEGFALYKNRNIYFIWT